MILQVNSSQHRWVQAGRRASAAGIEQVQAVGDTQMEGVRISERGELRNPEEKLGDLPNTVQKPW